MKKEPIRNAKQIPAINEKAGFYKTWEDRHPEPGESREVYIKAFESLINRMPKNANSEIRAERLLNSFVGSFLAEELLTLGMNPKEWAGRIYLKWNKESLGSRIIKRIMDGKIS